MSGADKRIGPAGDGAESGGSAGEAPTSVAPLPGIDSEDVLEAALAYAALGWHLLPTEGKRPARGIRAWSEQSTTDPEIITSWLAGSQGLGIGVDLARSGLVVIDVDHPEALPVDLRAALTEHALWRHRGHPERLSAVFRAPEGPPIGQRAFPWGNCKSAGGYVVLSPSPHAVGGRYRWVSRTGDLPPVLPTSIRDLVAARVVPTSSTPALVWTGEEPSRAQLVEVDRKLTALTDRLAATTTGGRNIALNSTAVVLGHYVPHLLSEQEVTGSLLDACARNGLLAEDGEASVRATLLSGLRRGMQEPQGVEVRGRVDAGEPPDDHEPPGEPPDDHEPPEAPASGPEPLTLDETRAVFRKWLGPKYDMQYLDVSLATMASGTHAQGDPTWVMFVGGSGVGKTETISAGEGAGCHVVSTIGSEAALLSGTPAKQRTRGATGGLLRQVGDRGVLIIKDFTSILSMSRDDRAKVLAALREVYDGRWTRTIGSDGGRTLDWQGRVTVIGGVTSAYDEHHGVIAAMGDRFLLCRLDSEDPAVRQHATRQALRNGGDEVVMRAELCAAVGGLMAGTTASTDPLPDDLLDELVSLADLVARSRSEVARDFKGDPQWAHAPEMPTRLAKQMQQMYRGALSIGLSDDGARRIVRRIAHDTIPPGRRKVLLDVWAHSRDPVTDPEGFPMDNPGVPAKQCAERVGMSRTTTDRVLQELAMHGLIEVVPGSSPWHYRHGQAVAVDLDVLREGYGAAAEMASGEEGGGIPETYPPL